ncbi:ATP phosphoribosyltransferase [Candidatus Daviesbacteria bacterium]|nr:ATP phosphoribosyltransferase [Candidatus Daviesbacteria bacterium]
MERKENIIAIPSKDKFRDESLELFSDSSFPVNLAGRQLTANLSLPEVGSFTVALLRPKNIIKLVAQGKIPLGIIGLDTLEEFDATRDRTRAFAGISPVQTLLKLGIGRCRFVLATSEESDFLSEEELKEKVRTGEMKWPFNRGIFEQFAGKTIATSNPGIVSRYFSDLEQSIDAINWMEYDLNDDLDGSVEAAIGMGMADAIADLVETGRSLKDNKLKEITTLLESEGVLITGESNRKGSNRFVDVLGRRIFETLLRRKNPDAIRMQRDYRRMVASNRFMSGR